MLSHVFPSTLTGAALKRRKQNVSREVTQEKFAGFLAWLAPEAEGAGEEYERLRFRLCTFFSQRRCRFPEELTDETINRVIAKVGEERIENKLAYCYGVARNVYRESLRKERDHLNVDELSIAAQAPEEPDLSAECLDRCLANLPDENRDLIIKYFSEVKLAKIELHRRISESFKVTQTALRMRVMRIKQKLKGCVRDCMCSEGAVT
jgi:DNA-directed RNA polymerase specialized sigma24 family protein